MTVSLEDYARVAGQDVVDHLHQLAAPLEALGDQRNLASALATLLAAGVEPVAVQRGCFGFLNRPLREGPARALFAWVAVRGPPAPGKSIPDVR